MLKHINAAYFVTKESGGAGGFEEKKKAAQKAGAEPVSYTHLDVYKRQAFALTTAVYRMDAKAQSDLQRRLSEEVLRFHEMCIRDRGSQRLGSNCDNGSSGKRSADQ